MLLQDCKPVSTVVFRVQGPDLADLLYAGTDPDLWGCKLLQILTSSVQLQLQKVPLYLNCCTVWMKVKDHPMVITSRLTLPAALAVGQSASFVKLASIQEVLHRACMRSALGLTGKPWCTCRWVF